MFSLVTLVWDPLGDLPRLPITLGIALTYTADLHVSGSMAASTSHLWTLAVEEQFYIVWPVLLVLGVRRGRLRGVTITAVLGLALLSAAIAVAFRSNPVTIYTLPTSWAAALAMGAAGYVWRDRLLEFGRSRLAGPAAVTAVALLVGCVFVPDATNLAVTYIAGAPLIAACTLSLIAYLSRWDSIPSSAWAPLRALGTISYAAYLWNVFVVLLVTGRDGDIAPWQAALTVPLTVAVATLSWVAVERPINMRFKRRRPAPVHA